MMDSSESSSDFDIDTAEQNTPQQKYTEPSSTLNVPRAPRWTEGRRPEDWNGGNLVSAGGSVTDRTVHVAKRRPAPHSDYKDVEAARRRVQRQRLAEAKKIHLEQLIKGAQREAQQLRQRATDLERETAEEVERLLREETEMGEGNGEEARSRDMEGGGDEDHFEVQSNCSHAPTEVYSTDDGDKPRWSSPSLL
jgi:hypothetical protein